MPEHSIPPRVIGCDVAKDTVVMFDSATGATHSVENSLKALRLFLRHCRQAFVVCEATGGFEAALLAAAHRLGLPVHRGDPRKISAFLRSLRSHGKTDPIDARGLARYGQERHDRLSLWTPPGKVQQQFQKLVHLRADMVAHRADYARRLKAPGTGPDKRRITALIKTFDHRITALEAEINRLVTSDDQIARTVHVIKTIPGCGPVTAITQNSAPSMTNSAKPVKNPSSQSSPLPENSLPSSTQCSETLAQHRKLN